MMNWLLEFGQGTLFRFAIAICVLGILRHVVLSVSGFVKARSRAGRKEVNFAAIVATTLKHANPFRYLMRTRGIYTLLTMFLHIGIIVVPLFLAGHILLWEKGLGFGWPALPMVIADALTLITIGAAVAVIVARISYEASRRISRFQDWLLPPLLLVIFASGYFIAHPHMDFLPYPAMRTVHVLCADLIIIMIPFTKLAHMILLPFSQLVSDMGWRFVPGAGSDVKKSLDKEGQPV